ncbi:MAG: hypothetical protein QOG53_2343 [Frankiales bacterium]|jgi:hypothetical protein|nr:hypothetical protein [Frankiales bacterium]
MSVHTVHREVLDVIASDSRPNVVMSAVAAQTMLDGLRDKDVLVGGCWLASPTALQRFSRPWGGPEDPAGSQLVGSVYVMYGIPTSYDVTIHRATVTPYGRATGWTPELVCADALSSTGLALSDCGRVELPSTPD